MGNEGKVTPLRKLLESLIGVLIHASLVDRLPLITNTTTQPMHLTVQFKHFQHEARVSYLSPCLGQSMQCLTMFLSCEHGFVAAVYTCYLNVDVLQCCR